MCNFSPCRAWPVSMTVFPTCKVWCNWNWTQYWRSGKWSRWNCSQGAWSCAGESSTICRSSTGVCWFCCSPVSDLKYNVPISRLTPNSSLWHQPYDDCLLVKRQIRRTDCLFCEVILSYNNNDGKVCDICNLNCCSIFCSVFLPCIVLFHLAYFRRWSCLMKMMMWKCFDFCNHNCCLLPAVAFLPCGYWSVTGLCADLRAV